MCRVTTTEALRARDDWPQIQQRYHTCADSLRSLAAELGVHHQQLKRALEFSANAAALKKKVKAKAKAVVRAVQVEISEPEPAEEEAEGATAIVPRGPVEFTAESILAEMREDQEGLREIAETHGEKSPYIAISARQASLQANAAILKAAMQYQIHAEQDLTKHPEYNRLITTIMTALAPYPEASMALAQALEGLEA
jgi:hypothetical protein